MFSSFVSRCAGTSVPLIICPSNWNWIHLGDKPCCSREVLFIAGAWISFHLQWNNLPGLLRMNLLPVPWVSHQPWGGLESHRVTESQRGRQASTQHELHKEVAEEQGGCAEAFEK